MSLIDEIRMISLLALREGEEFELKKGEGK